MIILDTNVVSALMAASYNPRVVSWYDRQDIESLWTTSVTVLESRSGLLILPEGKRRRTALSVLDEVMASVFASRILPFDHAAAEQAAELAARRQWRGVNKPTTDTMIAGIALSRGAPLATRNIRDFDDAGLSLINPFEESADSAN